ncbi:G-type lectin S-receptor-like serine/threonine-protein kinase [Camellia lanceoleosa]|uniref:G-type lectin S-receptor-like serine/threonine-protein kinase n=1 Tax=Camellia lanceoleosa TaxID=1840588 RepID=A0ACC0HH23_9ERIC|nr:G-type lectin S-receptor-like serine/threonine-protein kinase [Camellia lanceoleosa]
MRSYHIYNFSYHDNEDKSYFIYSIYDPSIISRFIIDISGQVKQLAWLDANKKWNSYWSQPRPQCEVYAFCWAFGTCNENTLPFCNCPNGFNPLSSNEWNSMSYSGGCVKRTKLVCGNNHEKDMFWEYPNTRLPKHPQSVVAKTVAEYEATCLNNCSCTAYAYDSNGCSIWIENLLNMQKLLENDDRGRTLYIRVVVSKYSNEFRALGCMCFCVEWVFVDEGFGLELAMLGVFLGIDVLKFGWLLVLLNLKICASWC